MWSHRSGLRTGRSFCTQPQMGLSGMAPLTTCALAWKFVAAIFDKCVDDYAVETAKAKAK